MELKGARRLQDIMKGDDCTPARGGCVLFCKRNAAN